MTNEEIEEALWRIDEFLLDIQMGEQSILKVGDVRIDVFRIHREINERMSRKEQ